jgi:DNA-binding LacI/PurR family transcriptional regulator
MVNSASVSTWRRQTLTLDMKSADLEAALRQRVGSAGHGEKLPPIRQLMREYKIGQAAIQEILGRMARQGLLRMQAGRGTFIHRPGKGSASVVTGARVLVLSAREQSPRSHQVASQVQEKLSAAGARCVQLVYERIEEALEVLRLGARFDACVLQSYFDAIPLGLLAFLRQRCGAVIADGARVTGVDLDAVASDWQGATDIAVERLRRAGHRRVALLAWPGAVQPLEGLRRHFVSLRRALHRTEAEMPLIELERIPRPSEEGGSLLLDAFGRAWGGKGERPTAMIALGLGLGTPALRAALDRYRLKVPRDLSVIVLGHVEVLDDRSSQGFDVVGSACGDAAHALVEQVTDRLEYPVREHRTIYLENRYQEGGSVRIIANGLRMNDPMPRLRS